MVLCSQNKITEGKMFNWTAYLKLYWELSVIIGIISTLYTVVFKKDFVLQEKGSQELYLNSAVAKGHLQKETYDTREVYYRKNLVGEAGLSSIHNISQLKKNKSEIYLLLFFISGTVYVTLLWPKILVDLLKPLLKK